MRSAEPNAIRIRCPSCAKVFEDHARDVARPQAEDEETPFTQEGRLSLCPQCGAAVALDLLEPDRDGVWRVVDDR